MTGMAGCNAILAGADNCRRPVNPYEGSVDDSHMLAMRVGSLVPVLPCNSVVLRIPLRVALSCGRDIVDRASHPKIGS